MELFKQMYKNRSEEMDTNWQNKFKKSIHPSLIFGIGASYPHLKHIFKPGSSATKQIEEQNYSSKWDFFLRRVNYQNFIALKF